ncbi:helix-turn-helix domain-containing protein [Bacillus infantis]|uniref:Tetratricopeptide repeat protein n=1 Tax=Bacillus infantis TaxID=324767 RepID=A0A5D4RMM8_9BACI|nr:helix-turn-helix domain-containing protein [Bacillus infantis]TYS51126.1 tetratricopeptide repeat protein [Bacillus infantis]
MQIKKSEIDFGKLVFYSRIKKELTQQQLSLGICSVPYLSKIENSKIEPNEETLAMLLSRLNINIQDIYHTQHSIIHNLEHWYMSIIKRDALELIQHQKEINDEIIKDVYSTDLIFYYHLVKLRHYLHRQMKNEAKSVLEILNKSKEKLTPHQSAYLKYFHGLYLCTVLLDFPKGLEKLESTTDFFNDPQHEDPEFFYHLSLTYTKTYNTRMAVVYVEKALSIFNSKLFFKRSLECQLLLGVNYGRLNEYQSAIGILTQILNVAPGLGEELIYAKALHNLGYMYSKVKEYNKAIDCYFRTLEHIDSQSDFYLNVIIELSIVLERYDRLQEAQDWIRKALSENTLLNVRSSKVVQLKVLEYKILNNDNELIPYLENTAIPVFKETNELDLLSEYYALLGRMYKKLNQYKKSSFYFESCLQLLKKRI